MNSANFWDDIAEDYAKKPIENIPAYQQKLSCTKARLSPHDTILDIGCGTGSLALELAPLVSHVHALDISSAMIRIANRKAIAKDTTNVTFHNSTLEEHTGFEPASFDGVCAYNILHLVPDRKATLDRLFALTKSGGFFVSSTVCLGDSWAPYGLLLMVMRWLGKAPPVAIIGYETIADEMRAAGFVDIVRHDVGAKKTTSFIIAEKP